MVAFVARSPSCLIEIGVSGVAQWLQQTGVLNQSFYCSSSLPQTRVDPGKLWKCPSAFATNIPHGDAGRETYNQQAAKRGTSLCSRHSC